MRIYRSLDVYERLQIYKEVIDLRKKGFSYRQIQEVIEKEHGVKLSIDTIGLWIRGVSHPLRNYNKMVDSPELAYVISAWLGDGRLSKRKARPEHSVALPVKDYDFAEKWGRDLAKALGRDKPYRPKWDKCHRRWVAKACSKFLYDLLKKAKEDPWILMPYLEKYPADACRGFFDAEGGVDEGGYELVAYNTDIRVIQLFKALLEKLGIQCNIRKVQMKNIVFRSPRNNKLYRRRKNPYFVLAIDGKENILKFIEEIGFTIARKRTKLALILERYNTVKIRHIHLEKCAKTLIATNLVRLGLVKTKKEAAKLLRISRKSIFNYFNKRREVSKLIHLSEIEQLSKEYINSRRKDVVIKKVLCLLNTIMEIYNGGLKLVTVATKSNQSNQ